MDNTYKSSKNLPKNLTNHEKAVIHDNKRRVHKAKVKKDEECHPNCEEHVFELKRINEYEFSKIKGDKVTFCEGKRKALRKPIIVKEFLKLKEVALFTTK